VSKKNSSEPGQSHGKKKFSLADMLKNAKKVEREVGKPIIDSLKDAGHIPGPFFDQLEEAVMNKVDSFSRKLDGAFTQEFSRKFEEIRQQAWKRAKDSHRRDPFRITYASLKGIAMMPPPDAILRSPERSSTYIAQGDLVVKLPKATMNWYNYNAYESSMIQSGLATGRVSTSVEMLEYQTEITVPECIQYIDELDELKYIYKAWWFLSRINRKNWIKAIYSDPTTKIIDYCLPRLSSPDGIQKGYDIVLFVIEGVDVYISVERLFDWIQWYRTPRKKYAIGECDDEMCLHYAIYLEYMYGIPEEIIRERLTPELIKDIKFTMELLNLGPRPPVMDDEDDDEAEALRALGIFNLDFDVAKAEEAAAQAHTVITRYMPVNFSDGIIDLSQLDDGEEDSFQSDEDFFDRDNSFDESNNLPYDQNLHASNNEFEALYLEMSRNNPDKEFDDDEVSVNSENVPDNELTAIEELGIDLIDPSRDTIDQPTTRRIGLVWDPGGGNRTNTKRFNTSLLVNRERRV